MIISLIILYWVYSKSRKEYMIDSAVPEIIHKYHCSSLNTTQLKYIDVVWQQIVDVGLLIAGTMVIITMTKTICSAIPIFIRILYRPNLACV